VKEGAWLGSDVDRTVDTAHRDRENTLRRQVTVGPLTAAVACSPKTALTEPGVHDVAVAGIDRKALRPAPVERELHLPRAVALVEARYPVSCGGVQPSHAFTLRARRRSTRRPPFRPEV